MTEDPLLNAPDPGTQSVAGRLRVRKEWTSGFDLSEAEALRLHPASRISTFPKPKGFGYIPYPASRIAK